jgi:hypothetical protein
MSKITMSIINGSPGTDAYYRYTMGFTLTDGVRAVAEIGECFWLLDVIISYLGFKSTGKDFSVWRCYRKTMEGQTMGERLATTGPVQVIGADDWDGDEPINLIASQYIEYSTIDFEGPYLEIFSQDGILFMPSEN